MLAPEPTSSSDKFCQSPAHSVPLANLEEGQFRLDIRKNFLMKSLARAIVEYPPLEVSLYYIITLEEAIFSPFLLSWLEA